MRSTQAVRHDVCSAQEPVIERNLGAVAEISHSYSKVLYHTEKVLLASTQTMATRSISMMIRMVLTNCRLVIKTPWSTSMLENFWKNLF